MEGKGLREKSGPSSCSILFPESQRSVSRFSMQILFAQGCLWTFMDIGKTSCLTPKSWDYYKLPHNLCLQLPCSSRHRRDDSWHRIFQDGNMTRVMRKGQIWINMILMICWYIFCVLYRLHYTLCIMLSFEKTGHRRKFRSQTSDNMQRWKSRGGKSQRGEVKKWEDKRWRKPEERRCSCAKR